MQTDIFHPLDCSQVAHIELPERFTNPFDYTPHPLVEVATEGLVRYIETQAQWREEIDRGKMFGVLVVSTPTGELGYLAAFSGYLDGKTQLGYFVPPICDLLDPNGFFLPEEACITEINTKLDNLVKGEQYISLNKELTYLRTEVQVEIIEAKERYKAEKQRRAELRKSSDDLLFLESLSHESQQQKGELKRLEAQYKVKVGEVKDQISEIDKQIKELKEERQQRSNALQLLTFRSFKPLNARGECSDLISIFDNYNKRIPPAGSGECAAPKLLHYAYSHSLKPIAMGEFWWGESTKGEVRHHLNYYPACRGKCHPILGYMLQGLSVDPARNIVAEPSTLASKLKTIYEDDAIVVMDKPSGLPSVRGLAHDVSVESIAEERYPDSIGHLIVHRLDMDTSGILVLTKSAEANREVQQQFIDHTIRKRYIAVVDGIINDNQGNISLPLILNPNDRPRQMVNFELGKPAYTYYKVLSRSESQTRLALYPQTGRTHQLRVHCAHQLGLNAPIVGDRLYGKASSRLLLHAEQITLIHPTTKRKMVFTAPPEY